jgi:hypothetical protein
VVPVGEDSCFVFSTQGKDRLYVNFETVLFKEPGDSLRFSYPADHPLAGEFEEQMVCLIREYLQEGEYLSVHHPKGVLDAKDDAPDATALALFGAAGGAVGEIVFV